MGDSRSALTLCAEGAALYSEFMQLIKFNASRPASSCFLYTFGAMTFMPHGVNANKTARSELTEVPAMICVHTVASRVSSHRCFS